MKQRRWFGEKPVAEDSESSAAFLQRKLAWKKRGWAWAWAWAGEAGAKGRQRSRQPYLLLAT